MPPYRPDYPGLMGGDVPARITFIPYFAGSTIVGIIANSFLREEPQRSLMLGEGLKLMCVKVGYHGA